MSIALAYTAMLSFALGFATAMTLAVYIVKRERRFHE